MLRLCPGNWTEQTWLFAGNSEHPTLQVDVTGGRSACVVTGDNAMGADNQQERPSGRSWLTQIPADLGHYLAGFADGEGSFNISFRPRADYQLPWKISMSFNIS